MTVKPDYPEACWEPVDRETGIGHWHDNDRWPHFRTEAKCDEAIAEIIEDDPDVKVGDLLSKPCFAGPCVVIVCDECGDQFDYEGDGGMHFDPADPMPVPITDCEWTIEERRGEPDRHYCPLCTGTWCDDCGEQHHDGCPDPLGRPVPVIDGQLALGEVTA